jgi:hypothetical protein
MSLPEKNPKKSAMTIDERTALINQPGKKLAETREVEAPWLKLRFPCIILEFPNKPL